MSHTRNQQLYDANKPLPIICKLLDHSSIKITKMYAQASDEKKTLV